MMNEVYLSLGSNIGDREKNIEKAIDLIQTKVGKILKVASNFENEAQGFQSQILFLNTCIHVQSLLTAEEILNEVKGIESTLGRQPKKSDEYESRSMDIDILFYNATILTSKNLTIPHPHFRSRNFVLIPLNEISPDLLDPITQLTVNQLLQLLED